MYDIKASCKTTKAVETVLNKTTDRVTEDVLIAIRRIMRAVDVHSKKLFKTCSLTWPQLMILKTVYREEQIPIGLLAREVNVSFATVSSILDRLEKRGVIKKEKGTTDKRKTWVQITDTGRNLMSSTPPLLQETFLKSFEHLQDWEQNLVLSSLQKVASMMNATDLDVAPILSREDIKDEVP